MQEESVASFATAGPASAASRPRAYAWLVFAITFGLMLSDYMSRQVLSAVFPQLKMEWSLSDTQLGLLSGIVGLMVGLLAIPIAMLADRLGRVKSVVLMALFWSLATLGCGLAQNYGHMLVARFLVGLGEAGYGSVGLAIILSLFPPAMRATLTGAFTAAGMFGSVLGMAAGGVLATHFGWRAAFIAMAFFGLLLVLLYVFSISEARVARHMHKGSAEGVSDAGRPKKLDRQLLRKIVKALFGAPTLLFTYVACGLQLFVAYAIIAWMPSYINRYYGMALDKSALAAAVLLIFSGIGMAVCGALADRAGRKAPTQKVTLAIKFCLGACVLLMIAMRLPPGSAQFAMIAIGVFFAAGSYGPAGAVVTNLVHPSIHATAIATLVLANNLLGGAPGPYLTGVLADRIGLLGALQWIPLISIAAALAFACARANYGRDLRRFETEKTQHFFLNKQ
ncbi:Hexuronate transporter [compost metagenome]